MGFDIGGWFNDRVRDFQDWQQKRFEAETQNPRGYDRLQNTIIIGIITNQRNQREKDANQDQKLARLKDSMRDFANELGLDPNNVSAASLVNRVKEIERDGGLTTLSDLIT